MEIQFLLEQFTENFPKPLMDHIQIMASGEAPFFPATLSLVYERLVERAFSKCAPFGSGSAKFVWRGVNPPTPSIQTSTSASSVASSSDFQAVISRPVIAPSTTTTTTIGRARLKCARCRTVTPVRSLYRCLYCPLCDDKGRNGRNQKGWPFMRCTECHTLRHRLGNVCQCGLQFT